MSKDQPKAFKKLAKIAEEAYLLSRTTEQLHWDLETNMPKAGVDFRAKQLAYLSGKEHELMTSKKVGDLIEKCEQAKLPKGSAAALNIREMRRQYDLKTKLPTKLVTEFQETCSMGHAAWAEARAQSDFSIFLPHLEKIVWLQRKRAKCFGYKDHPYDALLNEYERGAKTKELTKLFGKLQPELVEIVGEATSQRPRVPAQILRGTYPQEKQEILNRAISESIGFDYNAGRIDTSVHPFCCTTGPRDVRLTTRYDQKDFMSSFYGVMHETGHGLYEQGLPNDDGEYALPISQSVSLGIHESQSRLWENQIGRSYEFWRKWLPAARRQFPTLKKVPPKQMFYAANRAKRSFIRVDADEVTYDSHIILRFQLEKALITGDLEPKDLPEAWNEKFQEFFGLTVPNDANGCLQDVHWSHGSIGYFPTYSLGNINAAQLFHAALQDSTVAEDVGKADYASLLDWLRTNVHAHGSRYTPNKLIEKATGEKPNPEYLLEHLRSRYIGM